MRYNLHKELSIITEKVNHCMTGDWLCSRGIYKVTYIGQVQDGWDMKYQFKIYDGEYYEELFKGSCEELLVKLQNLYNSD